MDNKLGFITEPKLQFGYGQSLEDPRDGLTLFGPNEDLRPYNVQAGVIGTSEGVESYRNFVSRLKLPIISSNFQRPTFPGFEAVFGIEWPEVPAATVILTKSEIAELIELPSLPERSYRLVSLYLDAIKKNQQEEENRTDIWYVIVPRELWLHCRPKSASKTPQGFSKDRLKQVRAGQKALFKDLEEDLKRANQFLNTEVDFHNQLKARALQSGIKLPLQVMVDSTLKFQEKRSQIEFAEEMKAHIAWTQSTTLYYKLGKLPWRLADIRDGVCYLGLVFKRYERRQKGGFACSAAQMFLDSGDGTVFKGNVGPWKSRTRNEYHLDFNSARELLEKALQSYLEKKGAYPKELFIHGRARFENEEWAGFTDIVSELSPSTRLNGIVIKKSGKLKLYRDLEDGVAKYGNLRGLTKIVNDREAFLWTMGFVPRLTTSTSLEIPNALRIEIARGNSRIEEVLEDVLALTKLNYNACIYGDGIPVTLRFSDVIGDILTAVDSVETEVLPFKYYI